MNRYLPWSLAFGVNVVAGLALGQDIEREPINYSRGAAENRVETLRARMVAGEVTLRHERRLGYLRDLLQALDVSTSSQVLVFSKTSLQRRRISPKTPRAIYFNDDVYIGYCQNGTVLEIAAPDPELGTVFYTLEQSPENPPRIRRQVDDCLSCHASSFNQGIPGHVIRSVHADSTGELVTAAGSYRTDQTSPFEKRWGGWYVSGRHGRQIHMGNWIVRDSDQADPKSNVDGQNVTSFEDRFSVGDYPSPSSDLVALMVLEHQAEMHNRIARATLQTRQAVHLEQELNRELGRPQDERWPSTTSRIRSACEPLVQYLLYCRETRLTDPIEGTSDFAQRFAQGGPRDGRGRSLRTLELQSRLFRYPCSYLVHSTVFDRLPPLAKDYVLRRLHTILTGTNAEPEFSHLTAEDRQAILEILRDTKPDIAYTWRR